MTEDIRAVLIIEDLSYGYQYPLQEDLNLQILPGESVSLMGRSGSGKTTLLTTILGFHAALKGKVTVDQQDVHKLSRTQRAEFRRDLIGTIFQHAELLPGFTALENVMMPRLLATKNDPTAKDDATELLATLNIASNTLAENLSGGERQRTALARALINQPKLLLADEPTGSLDHESRDEALDLLLTTSRQQGCALLLVTHDRHVAQQTDRIFELPTKEP